MNTYGKFAQDTWKTLAPSQYALIPDPEAWFTDLGKQAETAVVDLMMQLEGPDIKGETYLEKVGRINAAKRQAEEIIRAEMLTPQPEDQEAEPEDEEESSMGVYLEYMHEVNVLHREALEDLHQEEMERDMKR
ncbi:TnpV protein [Arthrobacter sp.]|uniref:TnpV protein n=1 Tax=Arthrobacter sp. TaxID=1667 RepID=UPI003A92A534